MKNAYLSPGITIPICDSGLKAVRVRSRIGDFAEMLSIEPDKDLKAEELDNYLNFRGNKLSGVIFKVDALQPGCIAVLLEGEFDAMLAFQELSKYYTVCSLGSSSNTKNVIALERLSKCLQVIYIPDNDPAGMGAAQDLSSILGEKLLIAKLPHGKDLTEFET